MPSFTVVNVRRNADRKFSRLGKMAAVLLAASLEALAEGSQPPRRRIVVSIPDRKLVVVEDGVVLRVFPVAVGAAATPTPGGVYSVIDRIPQPTWYAPHRVVPPGTTNPLGTRWIGLSRKGYGIHGTNNPHSIGRRASHGCIRLRNAHVERLFEMVAVGDQVEFLDQPAPDQEQLFASIAGGR